MAQLIDAALLRPDATPSDIKKFCTEAIRNKYYSVDVNPCYVALATKLLKGSGVKVDTVIGYPLGANDSGIKAVEAARALDDGADEIDIVMAIGRFKGGDYRYVRDEIAKIVRLAKPKPVKVIIECSYLSRAEIVKACKLAKAAGAAFVKNGTGWGPRGATVSDVKLMRRAVGSKLGVKAAGGIRTAKQALALIRAGATRLGTSTTLEVLKGMKR